MHKFTFCRDSAADPVGGALSPDLLTVFTGPTTKGTEGRGGKEKRREKGKVKRKERRRGERRDLAHPKISAWRPLCTAAVPRGLILTQLENKSSHKDLSFP